MRLAPQGLLSLGAAALFLAACPAFGAPAHPDLEAVERQVIEGTNEFRAAQNLSRLTRHGALDDTARKFAEYLADGGAFTHDSGGTTPEVRVRRQGYQECVVAENLARHYNSAGYTTAQLAQLLVQAWKDSPGHRANMLEADALDTGIAVVYRSRPGREDFYAVQLLARSEATEVVFHVRNRSAMPIDYRISGKPFTLDPNFGRLHRRCAAPDLVFAGQARGRFEARNKQCYVVQPGGEVVTRASAECE